MSIAYLPYLGALAPYLCPQIISLPSFSSRHDFHAICTPTGKSGTESVMEYFTASSEFRSSFEHGKLVDLGPYPRVQDMLFRPTYKLLSLKRSVMDGFHLRRISGIDSNFWPMTEFGLGSGSGFVC